MDTGNFIPTSWVPVTPVKPIFPKPPPICTEEAPNQHGQTTWFLQEKYSDGFAPETQAQRIVSEATFRTNSQLLPGGERRFSDLMDRDRLRNFPFTGLIALADASVSNSAEVPAAFQSNSANIPPTLGSNPSRVGSFQSGENSIPSRPIYDLNSPPLAEEDEFLSMGHPSWFAPLTPGPPKSAENFQGNLQSSIVNERTERHGNEFGTTILDVEEFQGGKEHLQQLEDSSNAHKELQENHHPEVDLNQTPPQKARRKKHRPKVVIEGQPKKTPNTRTPVPEEKTPTVKRKYVRKSANKETMVTATVEVTRESNGENTTMRETRSCRRKLNYEFDTTSNILIGQGMKEKTQLGVSYDNTSPLGKEFEEFVLKSEKQVPSSQNPVKTDLLHELRIIQDEARRGKCRIVFSDETHDKQGSSAPRSSNESNYSRSTSLVLGEKALGSKRAHLCTNGEVEVGQTDVIEGYSSSLHQFPSSSPLWFENNGNRSIYFPAIYKKKRTEKVHFVSSSNTYCTENAANSNARQPIPWHMSNASVALYTPGANCRYSANQFRTSTASETGSLIDDQRTQQLLYLGQRMTRKRSKGSTRPRDMTSQTRLLEFREFPTFQSGGASTGLHMQRYKISHQYGTCMEALVADHHTTLTTKKRTKRSFSARSANAVAIWNQTPSIDEIVEKLRHTDINCQSNRVISSEQGALVPYNFRYERANALVVYQRDGTLVPYEGSFNPLKKRKPRPKVEIDEETDRVWKLLLENINSEGIDGTDEEKAKWWEDERSVFQGRADSFIARMHLVQGDRRFSPWKGSVLDSVVGVFLTQNVSDHLSSSAFMALAAKYPLKAKGNNSQCSEQTSTLSKELEVCILNSDGSNKLYKEKSSQSTCSGSPLMTHQTAYTVEKESVDSNESHKSSTSGNGLDTHAKSAANREEATSSVDNREVDGVFSCHHSKHSLRNSLVPSMAQTAERERSCLDTEADKVTSSPRSSYRSSFMQLLQEAETLRARKLPIFEEKLSSEQFNVLVEESLSSEISKKNEENCTSEQSGETAESVNQAETRKIATTFTESPKSYSEISHACSSPDRMVNKDTLSYNWPMWNPRANISSETQDHSCVMQQVVEAPNLSTETLDVTASSVIDDLKNTGNKELESVLKDDDYLPGKEIDETNSNRAQLKTGRMRKQKHKINWDSLRLQAQSEGKTRERSENTMDSLDWEAVRHADVNQIAYTIRERGMNNMLAERIKDFLNRLVREHGSTDLEWLRDVPPDKAKEYLLSIRGLGLKSVECVRLLTLHHLAFPVDTNVGRIAVRLGWVPLQPLPESLQLHLLELYPVLESIQKYLWPRLCKLDQRTLYELHYQMITFGKVFCTKSKPNCNACPMRGECRHFASAFASARLSLPGPEEKGIVCSSQTRESNHAPADIIKPLQLTPAQADGHLQGEQLVKMSEPVIEIPSTPEPIVEVPATPEPEEPNILECDIEDAFYEDHDEIPTIKLNIEQFAQNLQNYMQHNMELQEGEMSRALVSLTPDAASIPMPKLKNVNRLRTEHLVYELPDSHPLLEGLDKREPDDPCSYLLAIWTPGEMADSIQPPDSNCSSRENGTLCDEPRCFSCNSIREANNQTVRGTLLIPCRTAMRGSFPLNGTYFQVNEVFADHQSSIRPIDVPRGWLWNLPRRTVYFGTSIPTIFKGFSTESIQYCFWRGFVCVRGFDQQTRSPRPLMARLHFPASKLPRTRGQTSEKRE